MSKEKFTKELLVEGNDDQHVIWALCEKFSLQENFKVIDAKGISNLLTQISVRFKQASLETLGIIIDADSNLEKRWIQLKDILSKENFTLPEKPTAEGFVNINDRGQKVGVWIMPNNNINGMLEDFIAFLIPENDDLKQEVEDVLSKIEATNLNKYKDIHRSKAFIYVAGLARRPWNSNGAFNNKKILESRGRKLHCICRLAATAI
jgi:hypothetical protein